MPEPAESVFASSIVIKVLRELELRRRFLPYRTGVFKVRSLILGRLEDVFLIISSLIAAA
jgi:hypothetical protein